MTQIQAARKGMVTNEMKRVAQRERVTARSVRQQGAAGHLLKPANRRHLAGGQTNLPDTFSSKEIAPGEQA